MKIMKKSLLALAILSLTANLLPHGGGSGFGAGLATGAIVGGVTGAAIAGSRDDRYYDNGYYDDSYPVVAPVVYGNDYYDGNYARGSRYYNNRRYVRSNSTPRTTQRTNTIRTQRTR